MIKKLINDFKKGYNARIALMNREVHHQVTLIKRLDLGNGKPIEVIKDPIACNGFGYDVCCCVEEKHRYVIACDDIFDKLSEDTKMFTIYHEVGHIVHNHLHNNESIMKRVLKNIIGMKNNSEIEADSYAVNILGKEKSIKALKELIKNSSTKELKIRLKSIK